MLLGVISDTHGLLRPEALAALAGAERIVHAGDIGSPDILARLAEIAPVIAVRGNNDRDPWAMSIPDTVMIDLAGVRIRVIHDVHDLRGDPAREGVAVVVSGHSHRPGVEHRGPVMFVNPGSAGPRRFTLPISVARIRLALAGSRAELVELNVAPPRAGKIRRSTRS
jgi:hypothetical protein